CAPVTARPPAERSAAGFNDLLLIVLVESGGEAEVRSDPITRAFLTVYECFLGVAQSGRRLDQGVKYRLQIEGRAADNLEYVGGSGLLLQRLAQLVEQARGLNWNDRLSGEIANQVDLLVREWPYLLAIDCNGHD